MRIALAVLAAALAPAAGATDLVNKDNRAYAVSVVTSRGMQKLSIAEKSVKLGVCETTAASCVVIVEGVGEIEVTGADDVIIENARLSKK